MGATSSSEILPESCQVFINFREIDLPNNFISHLKGALTLAGIKYFMDTIEVASEDLSVHFSRIKQSKIALSIFSINYAKSAWCLDELVEIMEQVEKGKLRIIPVFFNVEPDEVRGQKGVVSFRLYGDGRWKRPNILKWEKALESVPSMIGLNLKNYRNEWELIESIVDSIRRVLALVPPPVNRGGEHLKDTKFPTGTSYGDIYNSSAGSSYINLHRPQHPSLHFDSSYVEEIDAEFFGSESRGASNASGNIPEKRTFTNSRMDGPVKPPQIQDSAELNFRGEELRYGFVSHLIMALKSHRIRSQLGMKIGCLLVLFFCLQQIAYRSTRLIDHGSAIDRIVEYIPTDGTRDKDTEFPTCKVGANPDSSSSDAKTIAADFFDRTCTNSPTNDKVKPPKIQVFINFRGAQLRNNFVGYLVDALRRSEINVFIDKQAKIGEDLNTLFKRIEDSGIAIVVFSSRYTESKWCLEELVKIKERVDLELLKVLPIFYKVTPTNVKRLKGEFGDNFRDKEYLYASDEAKIKRWKEAIASVSRKFALTLDEKSSILEIDFVETVVKEVLKMLQAMSKVESGQCSC